MPTQQHIDEIAGYLKSFKDGTRKHNQEHYHSHWGTNHCLAGWKELDDASSKGVNPLDWEERELGDDDYFSTSPSLRKWRSQYAISSGLYAQRAWALSEEQAKSLFDWKLSLSKMEANLKAIAAEYNLVVPEI